MRIKVDDTYKKHILKICVYKVLAEKPEAKRPLTRPRYRWEDNIKLDLKEIVWEGLDWIDLAQNRDKWALANTVMNLGVQ